MDVVVWLRSLGLEESGASFRDNKIKERVLPVASLGHRRKLLDAIAALRCDASGKAPSAEVASVPSATSVAPDDRVSGHCDVL